MFAKTLAAALATAAFLPVAAAAAPVLVGVTADVYDVDQPIGSVDEALALIDGAVPDAGFTVSALDYPGGPGATDDSAETFLSGFIGGDAATLTGTDILLERSVFVFSGQILLGEGEQTFTVGSDDGFRLMIDGALVSEFNASRSFDETSVTVDAGVGLVSFMLVFYEDMFDGGIEFSVDGMIAEAAAADAVPVPGAALLMLAGLGGGAWVRRRA